MMSNVSLGRDWSQGISGEGSVMSKESEVEKHGVLNCRTQGTLQNQLRKEERIRSEVPAKSAGEKSLWENAQSCAFLRFSSYSIIIRWLRQESCGGSWQ